MIDRELSRFLLFPAALCLLVLVVTLAGGGGSVYYAENPLVFLLSYHLIFAVYGEENARSLISFRLQRNKVTDALLLYRCGQLCTGAAGLFFALVVCLLLGQPVSAGLFGIRETQLSLMMLSPAFFFLAQTGNMMGLLDAVHLKGRTEAAGWILPAGSLVFGVILAVLVRGYGARVGALLHSDRYQAVYTSAGLCAGITAASFLTWLYLLFMSLLVTRELVSERDSLGLDHEEQMGDLIWYGLRKLSPSFIPSLLPSAAELILFHLFVGRDPEHAAGAEPAWDAMMGLSVPFLLLLVLTGCVFFTSAVRLLTDDYYQNRKRALRLRFGMIMRLFAALFLPVCVFVFGAAKPIVQIFHSGLTGEAKNAAVLSMKLLSPCVFFLGAGIILFWFISNTYASWLAVSAGAAGCAVTLVFYEVFLKGTVPGVEGPAAAVTIGAALWWCLLVLIIGRRLIRRLKPVQDFLFDYVLAAIACLLAVLPVILLNDMMTELIVPVGGVVILLILYLPLCAVFGILLGVDLHSVDRLPCGVYLQMLARMMHRYEG